MPIQPIAHHVLDFVDLRIHRGSERRQHPARFAHVLDATDFIALQFTCEIAHQVGGHRVDHPDDSLVAENAHLGRRSRIARRRRGLSEERRNVELLDAEHLRLQPVVDVVRQVRDFVCQIDDLRLEAWIRARVELLRGRTILEMRMLDDSLAHLEAQVESAKIRVTNLNPIDGAQALCVMIEAAVRCHQLVENFLAGVAEGGMPQIMRERDCLSQFFVEAERPRDRARDLRSLKRMRQPRAVVVALVIYENLSFVLEAPKRGRMNDAIAIARKHSAHRMLGFGKAAPATGPRRHRIRRQRARLDFLQLLPRPQHRGHYPAVAFNTRDATTRQTAPEVPRATSVNMGQALCLDAWVPIIETGSADVCVIRIVRAIQQLLFLIAMGALFAACTTTRPSQLPSPTSAIAIPQPTATPQVIGMASWYGPGFHGHKTSAGAYYDQEDLTAASIDFPLGSRVMVTNLDNGRSVEVTITDRGPFMKGRKIDLSHKAARVIGMLDPGTARVRISLISKPAGTRDVGAPLRYVVQAGSFSEQQNADQLRKKLAAYYSDVHIDQLDADHRRYYRVRMGAFATRSAAEARASDTARFGFPVVIITE